MKFHRLEIDYLKDNIIPGNNTFEIRRYDCGYECGDYIEFNSWPGYFFQIVYVLHPDGRYVWANLGMKEVGGGFFEGASEKITLGNGIRFSESFDSIYPRLTAPGSALQGKRLRKWQMVLVLYVVKDEALEDEDLDDKALEDETLRYEALGAFQILEIRVSDGNSVREVKEIPDNCDGNVCIVLERIRDERE